MLKVSRKQSNNLIKQRKVVASNKQADCATPRNMRDCVGLLVESARVPTQMWHSLWQSNLKKPHILLDARLQSIILAAFLCSERLEIIRFEEFNFYEIVNRSGKSAFIQLAISSRNATEDFMEMCDRINEHYPSKVQKADWQWRTPFKTSTIEIAEELSKETIFAGLDECLKEKQAFEADLKQKLGI